MSAPERVMLAPNGGLPTGNYPKSELVEYVRSDLCDPTQDERVKALIDLLRLEPWAIGWREWMLRRSAALRALEQGTP